MKYNGRLKNMLGTNTLAYFDLPSAMSKIKKLNAIQPGVNVIKLFSFVDDDEA